MKAYLFLADGFEEVEALTTADLLIRAGIKTVLVKVKTGESAKENNGCKAVRGAHDIYIKPGLTLNDDVTINELLDADCIILPGGMPGTLNLGNTPEIIELLKKYNEAGKLIAAICAAPSILGSNGLLAGKKATCFPGFEDKLKGAEVSSAGAVSDGNIITGKSMGSAVSFGLKIVEALQGKNAADKLEGSIYRG